ncbi:MAG TPA: WD40 repeat domain-containing protein [Myxococcota bacterium]|nr:WD40 repeat domain-containing protein [Myxococcota bacterium]
MTRSLVDRWCPEPHEASIVAVAYDHASRTHATADEDGLVAVYAQGSGAFTRTFEHLAAVRALALGRQGQLIAVGDDAGTLAVYRVADGQVVFVDQRPPDSSGGRGARAMCALAFSPDGRQLASLALDGRVRIDAVDRGQRLLTFPDFGDAILDWDPTGEHIVAIDRSGQVVLVDLNRKEKVGFPLITGRILGLRFTHDGSHVVVLDEAGLTLVDVAELEVRGRRATDRSSGMLGLAMGPDHQHFAVLTARSIHYFTVLGLEHKGKQRHTAPSPTGCLLWDTQGVSVADANGRMYRPEGQPPLPATVCVAGRGSWRLAAHEHHIAVWKDNRRLRVFPPKVVEQDPQGQRTQRPLGDGERIVDLAVDHEGRLLAVLPESMPLHVYKLDDVRLLFDAGPETIESPRVEVGLGVVACLLDRGGMRWFDLRNNRTYDLEWVRDFALTGGGSWLAVLTPRGRVRVLDPTTGEDVIPGLEPFGETPARLLGFVHRRPELLVLDEEGILGLYDLAPAARDGVNPEAYRILSFQDAEIDALWGLADGKRAVVRVQDPESGTASLVTVDLDTGQIIGEVDDLLPYVQVDPANGVILEPSRGNALLERNLDGSEHAVLRSLPNGEWLTFGPQGVIAASQSAQATLEGPERG